MIDRRATCEVRGRASEQRSATVRAPASPASATSRSRISAVARASGSARWHGSADVPKNTASAARLALSIRPRSSRRASTIVSTTGAASRLPVSRAELVVDEREVEPQVVTGEHGPGSPARSGDAGRAPESDPVARTTSSSPGRSRRATRTAPTSQIRACPRRSPSVSRSTTANVARSSGTDASGAGASLRSSPRADASRRVPGDTSSSRVRASADRPGQREQDARGVACRDEAALLDREHEPVGASRRVSTPHSLANVCSSGGLAPEMPRAARGGPRRRLWRRASPSELRP